jgi:hypothetical protein
MMILAGNARRGPTPGMVGAALVAARAVAGGRPRSPTARAFPHVLAQTSQQGTYVGATRDDTDGQGFDDLVL